MRNNKILGNLKSIGFVLLYLIIFVLNTKLVDLLFTITSFAKLDGIAGIIINVFIKLILITGIPLLIYYIIFKIRKKNLWKFCKFKQISVKKFLYCIAVGIFISVFLLLFMKIPYVEKNMPALESFFSGFDQGNILSYLLFSFIIYTVAEEVLFRGLIFNELNKIFPIYVSVIIQALLFAFLQSDMVTIVFAICSYVIYCVVYIGTDSIWGSITVLYTSHSFVMITRRIGITGWLETIDFKLLAVGASISIVITAFILFNLFRINRETNN